MLHVVYTCSHNQSHIQAQKCIQMHIKTKTRRYQTDGQAGSSWPHLWPWSWPRSECVAVIRATVGRCGQSHGHCQNMWLKSWPQSEHPLLVLVKYLGCGRVFRNSIPDNVAMLLNIKPTGVGEIYSARALLEYLD